MQTRNTHARSPPSVDSYSFLHWSLFNISVINSAPKLTQILYKKEEKNDDK